MRTHLKASKFVVVKAGTSTVSHDDGTPSLPRLGAIVEAVSQLMRQGTKVILVSSGAVGCGRSVLRKQAALHRTLRDHMKSQEMQEGAGYSAAAAAAGQLALMSLYETLFATQEIEPSQFLVTRRDFVDEACRKNLQHSIQAIMDVGMVPIINENDAVSGNAGYSEVPAGCFSDNDGLAALVAKLVGADCLIMLTDVEGLYDRPPSEAGARLVREVHPASLKDWKFGGISKGGRGGMEAKVNAALGALEVGIKSVVLASGSEPDVLRRVLAGDDVGTYFSNDIARKPSLDEGNPLEAVGQSARRAARALQALEDGELGGPPWAASKAERDADDKRIRETLLHGRVALEKCWALLEEREGAHAADGLLGSTVLSALADGAAVREVAAERSAAAAKRRTTTTKSMPRSSC